MPKSDAPGQVERWLEEVVIAHNLCPFAAKPFRLGKVCVITCHEADFERQVDVVLEQMERLIQDIQGTVSTTLIAYPAGLESFDDFLDLVEVCEDLAARTGASGFIQVAHFHPDYMFEGTTAHQASNYTNRSPVPIVQLLRVEEVTHAVDSMEGVEEIPARNIAHFEALGRPALQALWSRLFGQRRGDKTRSHEPEGPGDEGGSAKT